MPLSKHADIRVLTECGSESMCKYKNKTQNVSYCGNFDRHQPRVSSTGNPMCIPIHGTVENQKIVNSADVDDTTMVLRFFVIEFQVCR